jgi:glycosyltransferase involved in cell wall biosynthesis
VKIVCKEGYSVAMNSPKPIINLAACTVTQKQKTDTNPKVSIVVPIYNSQKTLNRCVESILEQTFSDFELILVNDGSTDDTQSICKAFWLADERVVLIDKPNTGVSDSRNHGIDIACGKYLQFVDSDDWLPPDSIAAMVKRAEQVGCHLLVANYYLIIGDEAEEKGGIPTDAVMTRREYVAHMMKNPANYYYGAMWNKLYRRDIIIDKKLRCSTELDWCEDMLFNLEYAGVADSFSSIQFPVYCYVKSTNGLVGQEATLSNSIKMKIDLFSAYKQLMEENEMVGAKRMEMTKFLVAYAKDGNIKRKRLPLSEKLSPAAKKLLFAKAKKGLAAKRRELRNKKNDRL